MFDNAEGMVFRPPSEANSFILRVTIGCSHNACTFCSMYKGVRFRIRPLEEVMQLIHQTAKFHPHLRRVFLADGNALSLPNEQLLTIMSALHSAFPKLSRITCYGGPKDILRKTEEELLVLKQAGLQMIYLGIESGDDDVLKLVNKGATAEEMIQAGRKVVASGIKLSAMVILGLGGQTLTRQHAINTGKVVSAINPTMLSALTLMLHDQTPLRAAAERGEFIPLSPYGFVAELEQLLTHTTVTSPCIFRSNHVSNMLPLAGTLPADRDKLLADVTAVKKSFENKKTPTYNDVGDF